MSNDSDVPPWERGPDCYPCGHKRSTFYPKKCLACEGRKNREHVDRLADVIRDAKRLLAAGTDPETERVLVHRLSSLMHPDPSGLIQHLNEQRENPGPRRHRDR